MAPSRSPKGKKTDGESVKEALERLRAASPAERAGEKASMATWSGTQCKTKLQALGVDTTGFSDTNLFRMMLSHTLDLGVTPKSTWSPKAVRYAVREMFKQPATDNELKGKAGKAFLAKLIAEDGDGGEKVNRELDYDGTAGGGGRRRIRRGKAEPRATQTVIGNAGQGRRRRGYAVTDRSEVPTEEVEKGEGRQGQQDGRMVQ